MSKVLRVKGTILLEMQDDETQEQAEGRLFDKLDLADFDGCVFTDVEVVEE